MFTEKNNERYMFKVWSIREQQMYTMEDIERIHYEEGKVVGVYATGERLIPSPVLLQWTNRICKNGDMVFDGDLVKFKIGKGLLDYIAVVTFDESVETWVLMELGGMIDKTAGPALFGSEFILKSEIIGNYLTHPDLVKKLSDKSWVNKGDPEFETMDKIDKFAGKYRFLSNFWDAKVVYEGIEYPTTEHAYQSAKTLDMDKRKQMAKIKTPYDVKKAGRVLTIRDDWDDVCVQVMYDVCKDKFTRNVGLRRWLLATGDAELLEGNTWNDTFWGVNIETGEGMNNLGKVLMRIREEFKDGN